MVIKKIMDRSRHFAREVAHFGRLGKVAYQRSFLKKERRKFLLKLGEKTVQLVRAGKVQAQELKRIVDQINKVEALLVDRDFGGKEGTNFHPHPKATKTRRKSSRKKK